MKAPHFIACLTAVAIPLAAAEDPAMLKFFESKVRPLLSAECYECHGEEKSKGQLRLDHLDLILEGGESGPALVQGDPDRSLLVQAIRRSDPDFSMPPKKGLTEEQVAILEEWVSLGAPWPAEEVTRVDRDEHGFTDEDRQWWAIQPVTAVTPPASGSEWARNAIDHFIAAKQQENHLTPAAEAGPLELIRRLTFDLHGLPPTPEVVDRFVADYSADPDKALNEKIEELLASPHYGERWGQHWLDVVRYAESDGYRADDFRPDTWRFRDYVINSFNDNKPYNQFVREQLAADEIAADDPETLIGTAFLRLGIYEWNQRNAEMQWDVIMTEMTNVTSEAFLGLGMGCAQCHDHKFDPILQKDYFALQAFLNSTWWPENATLATPAERAEYQRREAEWMEATKAVREEIDALTSARIEKSTEGVVVQFPDEIQDIYRTPAEKRTTYEEQIAQLVQRQVDYKDRRLDFEKDFAKDEKTLARYQELKAELAAFDHLKPAPLPTGFISTDVGPEPATTFFMKRGEKTPVEPAFLTLLDPPAPEIQPTEKTTGRRTALANWIADEKNPFSTRVIVNRVWQRHFGQGLVATPNDFGRLGEPPSHPELLDWLTGEFLEGGWKLKPLHRLIMTSATYRQTARREPTTDESLVDPQNRLLWRFPPNRLDAEQIRDAMLVVSGELKSDFGGPSVDGAEPRRSIYIKKRRNTPDPMIGGFDSPSGFSSEPTRIMTTTPNQSLMLFNGEWAIQRARSFAKRILANGSELTPEVIEKAYFLALGRSPLSHETAAATQFIEQQMAILTSSSPAPVDKYAGENGLRPASQLFKAVTGAGLGEKSLWLQPGSRFEKLEISDAAWPEDAFTIEAVAYLDRPHRDASVNTLLSRWNGSQDDTGWSFGVTSEKSSYTPRNFILQLIGDDFQHNRIYEVVPSNLLFPVGKPVYFAAAISARPDESDATTAKVDFFLKDLSDPASPLRKETRRHQVVDGLKVESGVRALIGGRDQNGHLWDGQLARLTVSPGILTEAELLISESPAKERKRILDYRFSGDEGEEPAAGTSWVRETTPAASDRANDLLDALTDFCHALINSNEFLYLH